VVPSGIGMQVEALAILSNRDSVVLDEDEVEWGVEEPSVLTVSPGGFLTARAPGETRVWATTSVGAYSDTLEAIALPGYAVTILDFEPVALDDAGRIVGIAGAGAVLREPGGATTSLGDWTPADMNDVGLVVGERTDATGSGDTARIAVAWQDGQLRDLPQGDFLGTWATAVNDAGLIVGEAFSEDGYYGVTWRDGKIDTLADSGPFPRAPEYGPLADSVVAVLGVGEDGTALGRLGVHAVAWIDARPVLMEDSVHGAAYDRHPSGAIVGRSDHAAGPGLTTKAVRWGPSGEVQRHESTGFGFCCLARADWAVARSVNDAGVIVGDFSYSLSNEGVYIYPDLPAVRLRQLVNRPRPIAEREMPGMCAAVDINDAGQIITGTGFYFTDLCEGRMLLDPLPF
ncbi:MAG: hypothetical protein P8177_08585, partial [Gemmatimonadota bacterium]